MILMDMHLVYPVMKRASQPVGATHGSDLLGAPALLMVFSFPKRKKTIYTSLSRWAGS